MFVPSLFVIVVPHIGVKVQVVVAEAGLDGGVCAEGGVRLVALVALVGLGAVDGDAAHEVTGFGRGQAVQQVAGGVRFGVGVERTGKVSVAVVPFAPVERRLQVQERLVPSELERVRSVEPRLAEELFVCLLGVSVAVGQEVHAGGLRAHVRVVVHVRCASVEFVLPVLLVHHVVHSEVLVRAQSSGQLRGRPFAVVARLAVLVHVVDIGEGRETRVGREPQAEKSGAVAFLRAVCPFGVGQPSHGVFPFQAYVHDQFLVTGFPSEKFAELSVFVVHFHVLDRVGRFSSMTEGSPLKKSSPLSSRFST